MSEKKYVKHLTWIEGNFQETPTAESNEITLTIDENTQTLILAYPQDTGLVTRRTVDRRVNSIAKSGFEFPDLHFRLGAGFEVIKKAEDEILSESLLVAGHTYGGSNATRPAGVVKLVSEEEVEIPSHEVESVSPLPTQSKEVPSSLPTQPEEVSLPTQPEEFPSSLPTQPQEVSLPTQPEEFPSSPPTPIVKPLPPTDVMLPRDYFAAGIFVSTFLQQATDLYISRKENTVTLEFDRGSVSFELAEDNLKNFTTQRVSLDDALVKQAQEMVKKYLSK
jgi:hypothetical protein